MSAPVSSLRAVGAFVLVSLIWGSTWLVIKDQIGVLPPAWAVTCRFAMAAAGMFVLALVRGAPLVPPLPMLGFAGLVGMFQFFANFQLVYRAELHITSGLVAVVFALLLVPNTLLARLFIGTEVSRRFIVGSLIAIGGIVLLTLHEYRAAGTGGGKALVGIGLALLATLSASISNVMQATTMARRCDTLVLIAWAMLAGTIFDGTFALATEGMPHFHLGLRQIAGIAYLALVGSVITFPLYFMLIREWGPGPAAYSSVLIPVVAMGLSTLFEGYRWSQLALGGAVLVLVGLLIALAPARNVAEKQAASPSR